MLQAVESAITDRLGMVLPAAVRVLAFPDIPIEQGFVKGATTVYVRFAGIELDAVSSQRSSFAQRGFVVFEVRFLVKDLRSHIGAYPLMELVQKALSGWLLSGSDDYSFTLPGLQMTRMELIERLSAYSLWDWGMMFRIGCIYEGHV